jgi:hypothetical protein
MSEITLTDTAQYSPEIITNLQSFAYLTQKQKIVLNVMIEGMTTDLVQTDRGIAEKAQVHPDTVRQCRHNVHFLSCLSQATQQLTKSEVPLFVQKLKEIALKKGSVKAIDLLLRYTGDFVPKSQLETKSQSINANINFNTADGISEFVTILCSQGWNIDRIHAEIDEAYQRLKEQSAVV